MKHLVILLVLTTTVGCNRESPLRIDSDASEVNLELSHFDEIYGLDPDDGWFPHEVGNYWINEDFIPCNDKTKEWYWEIIDLVKTDSADFFLIEKHLNPCDTTDYYIYNEWFAYTNDHKLYLSNEKFEYDRLEGDFNLGLDESYIAQGLRYTVITKTEIRMVFEYDLYFDGTYTRRWIRGLGRDLHWDRVKISGNEYVNNKHFSSK